MMSLAVGEKVRRRVVIFTHVASAADGQTHNYTVSQKCQYFSRYNSDIRKSILIMFGTVVRTYRQSKGTSFSHLT